MQTHVAAPIGVPKPRPSNHQLTILIVTEAMRRNLKTLGELRSNFEEIARAVTKGEQKPLSREEFKTCVRQAPDSYLLHNLEEDLRGFRLVGD